jgi:hypothetical protein
MPFATRRDLREKSSGVAAASGSGTPKITPFASPVTGLTALRAEAARVADCYGHCVSAGISRGLALNG